MFKRYNKPILQFISTVPGLSEIPEICPQPSNHFIPKWWKELPKVEPFPTTQTVKVCPSFPDFFSQGVVLPMWADTILSFDKESGDYSWIVGRPDSTNPFSMSIHGNQQFLDYVIPTFHGKPGHIIFKADCPWKLITPKGYSVLQLPLYYHFNNDFSVLPGIIHTDVHHELNQQIVYYGDSTGVVIKRGTPLVQYIPFKRTDYQISARDATQDDLNLFLKKSINIFTKFVGTGQYNRLHKKFNS